MSRKKTNKVKFELETEGGEIAQVPDNKKKPFKIERGGIAKPLGNGFYYLQGRSHEDGGIDMTFNTDARIFSSVPFLNGKSPAERIMRGENPDTTFAWQEEFKDVNRINDDGSRKAENGKEVKVVPTREEYITSKIDSIINSALDKSRTRKYPSSPLISDRSNKTDTELHITNSLIDAYSTAAATAANKGNYETYYQFMNKVAHYGKRKAYLQNLKDKGLCEGNSCIYTATDNYGKQYKVASNVEFAKNPNKYGFIKIDTADRKIGDLQQIVVDYNNHPYHMMMLNEVDENGLARFNYSAGGHDESSIRVNAKYPLKEEHIDTYRFVGTPADSVRWTNEYNKLYMNNNNKKQLGGSTGLIRVQANGKDRLMYIPFTGEEIKANRKKAALGIELNTPKLSYDFTEVDKIMESIKEGNKNKKWWKKDWAAPTISALGNIGASLTSYFINKNMLNDLNYAPTPVAKRAAKLKTNININPELTALRENLSRTIDTTNANTVSSRVANARNQAAMLNTTLTANKLYADKENRETALINQDRLNQQEVANANIDAYNTWRTGKTNFENTVREKQSENSISLVDNINSGIQGGITDYEKRRQFRNNLAVMAAAYPNVTPELLRSYGFDIELPGLSRFGGKVKLNKKK